MAKQINLTPPSQVISISPIFPPDYFVESQFNILKDVVLRRTKEFNIVGLIEKLLFEFDSHYQNKLISVANGSFDGIYSGRFSGKKKNRKERIGYQVPAVDDIERFCQRLITFEDGVYVASQRRG